MNHLQGYRNVIRTRTVWRPEHPQIYLLPEWDYNTVKTGRHHDALGREWSGIPDDRYLSPWHGRPKKLVVQTTDALYAKPGNATYRRTFIRNISPMVLQVAGWALGERDFRSEGWKERAIMLAKCIPAAIPMILMASE